jgi:uncharacterized protein YcbK (DUF882 family)
MPDQLQRLNGMRPEAREHVVHLLARFPSLVVSSALRSAERNRAVGGVPGSLHVQGRAVDLTASARVLEAALAYVQRGGLAGHPGGPTEAFIEGTGPQSVGGQSTGTHLHVAW